MNIEEWSKAVGSMFDLRPRVAVGGQDARWIRRTREERALRQALAYPSMHVCVDGPSGSGKTSITKTVLSRMGTTGLRHVYIKLNATTTWHEFKLEAFESRQTRGDISPGASVKLSFAALGPVLDVERLIGRGSHAGAGQRAEVVAQLAVHHIARTLVDQGLVLVVDDVNFASDDVLLHLRDLCKTMTDDERGRTAKVVLVGTDDVYQRLVLAEGTLRDRVENITIGSLPERADAWLFITSGLEQLGLKRPEKDRFITREQLAQCQEAVYNAADGMPKSIVTLGRQLAMEAHDRPRVSAADILKTARGMTEANFREYRRRLRDVVASVKRREEMARICAWLYAHGPTKTHQVEDLIGSLEPSTPQGDVLAGVDEFVRLGFLVRTGRRGDRLYTREPLAAHTLGLALRNPALCGADEALFNFAGRSRQLTLAFDEGTDPNAQYESWLARFLST